MTVKYVSIEQGPHELHVFVDSFTSLDEITSTQQNDPRLALKTITRKEAWTQFSALSRSANCDNNRIRRQAERLGHCAR